MEEKGGFHGCECVHFSLEPFAVCFSVSSLTLSPPSLPPSIISVRSQGDCCSLFAFDSLD